MFNMRNSPAEPVGLEGTICDACQLVPVSILSLDVAPPVSGWEAMLAAHNIELIEDDMGRMAIRRADAQALMHEQREWELKSAEETRRR